MYINSTFDSTRNRQNRSYLKFVGIGNRNKWQILGGRSIYIMRLFKHQHQPPVCEVTATSLISDLNAPAISSTAASAVLYKPSGLFTHSSTQFQIINTLASLDFPATFLGKHGRASTGEDGAPI